MRCSRRRAAFSRTSQHPIREFSRTVGGVDQGDSCCAHKNACSRSRPSFVFHHCCQSRCSSGFARMQDGLMGRKSIRLKAQDRGSGTLSIKSRFRLRGTECGFFTMANPGGSRRRQMHMMREVHETALQVDLSSRNTFSAIVGAKPLERHGFLSRKSVGGASTRSQ